jgi:hypothetical protein
MSKRRSIFQPVCLAVILGLGIQVAVAFVVGWFTITGTQMMPSYRTDQILQILADGTPIIGTYTSGLRGETDMESYSTLEGTPIDRIDPTLAAVWEFQPMQYLPGPSDRTAFLAPREWRERIVSFYAGYQPPVFWYFVHDGKRDGSGYFVGFDRKSKRCVGYIGRQGARSDSPNDDDRFPVAGDKFSFRHGIAYARHFRSGYTPYGGAALTDHSNPLYWKVYLLSQNHVLEVDLRERSVRTVMESDGMISIGLVRRSSRSREQQSESKQLQEKHDVRHVAIRTADEVIVLDPSGGERLVYPIPAEVGRRSMDLIQLSDETLFVGVSGKTVQGSCPNDLYWIRPGGEVQRRERVALQTIIGSIDPRVASGLAGIVAPVPAAWAAIAIGTVPAQLIASGEAPDYASALAESLSTLWPGLLILFLLTALAVWLCTGRQRRYAMPWTRTWVAVMLLLGFPAFLGYLFHRVWPARVDCPACGKAVPRDRGTCPECHVPYPDPAPTGSEVFA